MSWDLVVLTVREPTPAHQRMTFDAWPERIRGVEAGEWLEEVVSVDGALRFQIETPGVIEDLDQLRFLEVDLSPVLSPPVWFTEINVPAGGGDEGRMLAALLARTLIAECGGLAIDLQTGSAFSSEGPVDLAGVMVALDRHLPAAYPTRWGWDEPLLKKPWLRQTARCQKINLWDASTCRNTLPGSRAPPCPGSRSSSLKRSRDEPRARRSGPGAVVPPRVLVSKDEVALTESGDPSEYCDEGRSVRGGCDVHSCTRRVRQ